MKTPEQFLKESEITGTEVAGYEVFTRQSTLELMSMYYNYKLNELLKEV